MTRQEGQGCSQGHTPKGSGALRAAWDLLPHLTKGEPERRFSRGEFCTRFALVFTAHSRPRGSRVQ